MSPLIRSFPVVLLLMPLLLPAQEPAADEKPEEKEWLEYYYQEPKPDQLVPEVKDWAQDGTFANPKAIPAVIGFLSQVFRQNRDKIAEWYGELSGLNEEQMQFIHTALLYSRTTEADAILGKKFGAELDELKKELPKILELNPANTETLSMIWGFFYATGSETAIRRVIWAFRYVDAPDNPDFAKVPKEHVPLYKMMPDIAAWSLTSNAERHPRVLEICEKLYADEKALTPVEKSRLRVVLSELEPKKYPPPEE